MSSHLVIRRGHGALHIAEPTQAGWATLCGRTITLNGPKVFQFSAGKVATAVWGEWKRCGSCEAEDKRLRKR